MKISLIIPCYNEEKSLEELHSKCKDLAKKIDVEIIFVNNGSTDNSKKILSLLSKKNKNFVYLNIDENKGYGGGILEGLNKSKGDYIGWTHADLQTNPSDLIKASELINKNKNIFIKGKRFGRPLFDNIFTIGMSFFTSIILSKRLWDINAQPTIFPKEFFDLWQNPPNDFSLDLYAYYLAKKFNLKIKRIPVFFDKRKFGSSSWNLGISSKFKFIVRTMKFTFKLRKDLLK